MRIGGIASGMDTEQMVKDLMRAERVRVDKYFRQEEALKWKRDALNTTNKTLAEFILKARSGFGLTTTTSTGTVVNKTSASFDWVKKVSLSSNGAIQATASANAMEGTYKIKVENVAEVASVTSADLKTTLNSESKFSETGSFTITGKNGTASIEIGANTSISDVVKQINDAVNSEGKSLGLRAAYDTSYGKLMITTKEQGSDQFIKVANEVGSLAETIFGAGSLVLGAEGEKGVNAKIIFNGDTIEKPSNNFSMFGVNYQLQSLGEVTINVESNIDGIVDKVKSFVEDYNKLIDDINGKLKEKSYRDFQPLTKEEREAMKEKEIELWEEKAKSGLLRNDETLTRVLQTMREGLYKEVEGLEGGFNHITQIGITTGNYQNGGKLEINEDKLRNAIIDNPDGVIDLLFKKSDTKVVAGNKESLDKNRAESGLVERLFNDMITGMKDIVRRSGTGEEASLFRSVQSNMLIDFVTSGSISVLDRDLMNIGSRIANEERILIGREDRYWRQFTAMEKALEKMNQQSGWLQSQLGQMAR